MGQKNSTTQKSEKKSKTQKTGTKNTGNETERTGGVQPSGPDSKKNDGKTKNDKNAGSSSSNPPKIVNYLNEETDASTEKLKRHVGASKYNVSEKQTPTGYSNEPEENKYENQSSLDKEEKGSGYLNENDSEEAKAKALTIEDPNVLNERIRRRDAVTTKQDWNQLFQEMIDQYADIQKRDFEVNG